MSDSIFITYFLSLFFLDIYILLAIQEMQFTQCFNQTLKTLKLLLCYLMLYIPRWDKHFEEFTLQHSNLV